MLADSGKGASRSSATPADLRAGVPDERLASRELEVFDGVEVAHTRYLPTELTVPPLKGYTVNLRLGGTGRVATRLGGRVRERPLSPGLIEVFEGSEPLEWALEGSISENVNVLLDRDFVGDVASEAELNTDEVEILDALNTRDPEAERILLLFLAELRTGGVGGELYVQSLANLLAVHLLRRHSSFGRHDKNRLADEATGISRVSARAMRRATDYIGDNLGSDLSLEALSAAASLSPRHFSRLFKEFTGLPPHQFVIRRRIERARSLLRDTDLSVGEVSVVCGFSHQGHLARHFVRLTGVIPTRFRAESRR